MARSLASLAALVLLAGPADAQDPGGPPPAAGARPAPGQRFSYANPSAVIAAELAFARDAQQRGQWTAFAAAAAPDAVMFVPRMVWAQQWLLGRANPPQALRWQPQQVWSSCDGTLMVSRGTWQAPRSSGVGGEATGATPAPRQGWFTTLWQRQPDGAYRWVLDHGDEAASLPDAPEMISALVADCPPRARPPGMAEGGARPPAPPARPPKPPKPPKPKDLPPLDPASRSGAARDGSLRWDVAVTPEGARTLTVHWRRDGQDQVLLTDRVAAPDPRR
ncbi:hypothetical protein H7F50_17220 [Novosphingobium flavum]|uniref:hypothetical protein n=1 Tax=Novosphingobium aerophilum TaxID=2839843 RepID=UPI001639D572|nr:hypothetical protein [Novosphingobium aerophilum]MBC2663485.1 hypothetical protein [Novosphingobium aerophilum]